MIAITGAAGKLGRQVIEELLEKVPAAEIIATVRNPEKARDFAAVGIKVRQADYSKPETLRSALAGAEKVLLISSSEVGQRIPQHQAIIDAANSTAVKLLAYTSILRADSSTLALASEHKGTEENIRASGLPFVFLRNGWYLENHTEQLGPAVQHGAILGAAGEGHFASAARSDYAAAAVAVLTGSGHENKTYELAGENPFTLSELAAIVSVQAGKQVSYHDSAQDYRNALLSFGLPADFVAILVDADLGAARGELDSSSSDLVTLIGRPTVTLMEAVKVAFASRIME